MAKAASRTGKRAGTKGARRWPKVLLILAVAIAGLLWFFREPVGGYSGVSTAYMARVGCACRFIGGRDMEDCAKDRLSGMELVSMSEDAEAQSVTARFALMSPATATYREGYGCVLEDWDG